MKHRASFLFSLLFCWTVAGQSLMVIDGDTFDARIGIWHGLEVTERVRVLDLNTPEMKNSTKKAAEAARSFTAAWLARGPFKIETCKRDAFGRILAKVYRDDGDSLADALIKADLGAKYGKK